MSSNAKRRCIAVGMGGIARVVVPGVARQPWAEIAGIVDVNPDALADGRSDHAANNRAGQCGRTRGIQQKPENSALQGTAQHAPHARFFQNSRIFGFALFDVLRD